MLCSARRVQRSLCGGSQWLCRFGQDRGHCPEAVGAHDHTASGRDFTCPTELMTESAADRIGCWPAGMLSGCSSRCPRVAWRELPSSLRDAMFAEVNIRAGDHMSHLGLEAVAGAAVDRTYGSVKEPSGNALSDARVALNRTSLNGDYLKLYGMAMSGAT